MMCANSKINWYLACIFCLIWLLTGCSDSQRTNRDEDILPVDTGSVESDYNSSNSQPVIQDKDSWPTDASSEEFSSFNASSEDSSFFGAGSMEKDDNRDDSQPVAQTKDFPLTNVKSIEVDHNRGTVTLKKSDTDKITIMERMNRGKKKPASAKIDLVDGILVVTGGSRSANDHTHSKLEIYLPESYQNSIFLRTANGSIFSDLALSLSSFHAGITNGKIFLSNLSADDADFTATNGFLMLNNVVFKAYTIDATNAGTKLDHITGIAKYTSKNGGLIMIDGSGSGSFEASGGGNLKLGFSSLSGDLSAYSNNGGISVTIPKNLSFTFSAATKNGGIQTPFSDSLTLSEHAASGVVGAHPSIKIKLETNNGNIHVNAH